MKFLLLVNELLVEINIQIQYRYSKDATSDRFSPLEYWYLEINSG
jgi:hypothetical protein